MSQSTLIVSAILAAFIVWVTLNGHLGVYLGLLGLSGSGSGSGSSAASATAYTALSGAAQVAADVAVGA